MINKVQMCVSFLFFLITTSHFIEIDCKQGDSGSWPKWKWTCYDRKCTRNSGTPSGYLEQSPTACRLACDTFGSLWPRPTGAVKLSQSIVEIHPENINVELTEIPNKVKSVMLEMIDIFEDNLKKECSGECTGTSHNKMKVELRVHVDDKRMTWSTNESYVLDLRTIDSEISVQITAPTIFGARHGLESLTQLMTSVQGTSGNILIILTSALIVDRPAYPHRGLMLDTARHFIPVSAIQRSIDGMAASKMNVLHWHATDSQSFPIVSPSVPQLSSYGAYSKIERYHPSDIRNLMHYAKLRGIRIIIELDAPAHAGAGWQWGRYEGYGDLVVCWAYEKWREKCIQPPCGQLNPANPLVFQVLKQLYQDIAGWMPKGEVFHMGGDEVFFPCWNSSTEIIKFMHDRGMGTSQADFIRLWAEYQQTALKSWDEARNIVHGDDEEGDDNSIMLWSSHLTAPEYVEKYLPKERYVIQTWVEDYNTLPEVLLKLGYRVILSTKNSWYLDHGFWGQTKYSTWRNIYDNRLPRFKNVLGGEACMWTEYVDEHTVDARVWPRTAAMAERLWSDPSSSSASAEFRFNSQRERLIKRGIQTEATSPGWCLQNDGRCA